jgi:hypothetical protein
MLDFDRDGDEARKLILDETTGAVVAISPPDRDDDRR